MFGHRKVAVDALIILLISATLTMLSGCGSSSAAPQTSQTPQNQGPGTQPPPNTPPPQGLTVSITAAATTVAQGGSTAVSWETTNAVSLEIEPEIMDDDPLPLNFPGVSVGPLQQTITYVATATDKDGQKATSSVTINVTPGPPTVTLLATPAKIISGQPSTLSWTSENATSLSIDNNVGTVPGPESSKSVSPTLTTTYTITAKGTGGTTTAQAIVNV